MTVSKNAHTAMMTVFSGLKREFDQSLKNAQQQEQGFLGTYEQFRQNVHHHLQQPKNADTNNPLSQAMDNFSQNIKDVHDAWDKNLKNQETGVKFRSKYEDSLLVFVFGKVKSGKSSLGNYMAWGHTDPTDELKQEHLGICVPEYFSEAQTDAQYGDKKDEAKEKRQFRVGATEATSSIQGFRLDGLTWVDSPGLHSVQGKNGELAQEYVKHADLILYTMTSNEPGRGSDVQEIAELHNKGKKVVLLITGSDTSDEDEDEEGNIIHHTIMKSQETRKMQQQTVRNALEAHPDLSGKSHEITVISLSAKYAQLHPTDADEFKDSGMGELFEILATIAKNNGIKLKQQTPLKNLHHFLLEFTDRLQELEQLTQDFTKASNEIKVKIPVAVRRHTKDIQRQLSKTVDEEFQSILQNRHSEDGTQRAINALTDKITEQQNKLLAATQQEIINDTVKDFGSTMSNVIKASAVFNMPEFKLDLRSQEVAVDVRSGTKNRNSGIGGLAGVALGVAAGFIFGGPLGALAGASLGGTIGSVGGHASGDGPNVIYDTITTVVGDNLHEIRKQFADTVDSSVADYMAKFETHLISQLTNKADGLSNNIQNEITTMKQACHTQQQLIQQQLI